MIGQWLSLDFSAVPGTSGRATVTACDPGDLCAQVDFKVLVQPEFTQIDPGDFSVEAPYCEDPLVYDHYPSLELEICARDLEYEDGDELTLKLIAQGNELLGHDFLDLDFDPLSKSWSCKTVEVQGHIVDLQYQLEPDSKEIYWWDWDTEQPLCQIGQSPDCFVGPELWNHPGNEENRGELTIRTLIDSDTREWAVQGWGFPSLEGTIRVQAMALDHKECGAHQPAPRPIEPTPPGLQQGDPYFYCEDRSDLGLIYVGSAGVNELESYYQACKYRTDDSDNPVVRQPWHCVWDRHSQIYYSFLTYHEEPCSSAPTSIRPCAWFQRTISGQSIRYGICESRWGNTVCSLPPSHGFCSDPDDIWREK